MRKFVLVVEYATGKVSMLTHASDIIEAIAEFKMKLAEHFGTDYVTFPDIARVELLPIMYESKYANNDFKKLNEELDYWKHRCSELEEERLNEKGIE
jgi:hypothetical protein